MAEPERPPRRRYRIGVDIGGTFTDFTLVDEVSGEIAVAKELTTPQQPERAVMEGIASFRERRAHLLEETESVVHATTLATNVIIERKGAPTGLLTTEGFRDILEIGREARYHIYDLFIVFPEPLVPRPLRIGVSERVYSGGEVLEPLDEDSVRNAAAALRAAGVESVAVSFLHAYANPAHERRVRELLAQALPGVSVSLSHEVHPEPKEFERTSTTVVDAYVKPVVRAYLERLESGLAAFGYDRRLLMMQSNGGTISAETARDHPATIIESGPAAGVEAAAFYGRMLGISDILSFDMGGTTAKLCLIENGHAARTRTFEVDRIHRFRQGSGLPVAIPVYDLLELGAGGGSIARVSDLGLIEVGPASAGSDPGPACYGRGGTAPTVTDADLVLGHLDPGYFLGGEMALDPEAARGALKREVAAPSGMAIEQAAHGIVDIVGETMASAARVYIADKGKDASHLTMIGFGGAGPLHAVGLARKLGCRRVVIPPMPGVMSSFGLLASPLAFEQTLPVRQLLDEIDPAALEGARKDLERKAAAWLPDDVDMAFRCVAEMRHLSQDYPLEVEIAGSFEALEVVERARADFYDSYARLYGRTDDDNPLELVLIRIQAYAPTPRISLPGIGGAGEGEAEARGARQIYSASRKAYAEAPVFRRHDLPAGAAIPGPAIIEERESTTVIHDGDRATVDERGFLVIELADAETPAGAADAELVWN